MKLLAALLALLTSTSAFAAGVTCFDNQSFGAGRWVKVDLKLQSSGLYDANVEWSTGATSVTKSLDCHLAVIGSSPVLVDGSCLKSGLSKIGFQPGTYSGTMTIILDLSRTIGSAFKCERTKKFDDDLSAE